MKVPDLADTEGPVTESNCIGAITPGGEQLEVNDQSVTPGLQAEVQSELGSVGGFGEPASVKAKPKRNRAASAEGVDAAGREPQMVGDRMVGNPSDVNQGTTAGDERRAGRGQSVRSSREAGNDCGAKGRRKVVLGAVPRPTREGRRSAARLSASVREQTAWWWPVFWQWAARDWVSGTARSARLVRSLRASRNASLSQPIEDCRLESRMREIRLSGLGGRGSVMRSSYPHLSSGSWKARFGSAVSDL